MQRLLSFIFLIFISFGSQAQTELLAPDKAFIPSLIALDSHTFAADFNVAPQYYLYRDRISFSANGHEIETVFPKGEMKDDPSFGRVEVYKHDTRILLKFKQAVDATLPITFKYQGCADAGICYPPQTQILQPGKNTQNKAVNDLFGSNSNSPPSQDEPDYFAGSFLGTLGVFFLAGIGLALTACMYPLIPIVSGIVIGHNAKQIKPQRWQAFALTFIYVQGMALAYTAIGIAAAATGTLLVVVLQQPIVIAAFALFFVMMALAMLGVFHLQLPQGPHNFINNLANRLPGGRWLSVFVMGLLSALLVGPCIAPPLAAALAYLGKTGDLFLGGAALYMMALGLGLPLLLIGAFGSTILPRLSGRIMQGIKIAFGIALLGMALWVSRPLWEVYLRPAEHQLNFATVTSSSQLDQALLAARGKPVMVDFYADWCVACIEFERETLSDDAVQDKLKEMVLIRVDVTKNSTEDAALLARFGLYGPPALIFYSSAGQELKPRVIGFQNPRDFLQTLSKIEAQQ
ncbi:protein-disulfide reductase DsbD [Deefgea piscis]|uniref:protein-disulfide reductase DsbD n=1 Tax=Deefgea piscis TaxID=2739061 RepID=UPI001C81CDB1|nr:protein-disulfide reductase DsbD [Deefgea piscis]QZA81921.1 protein-disulfide reductase DsbD [Deefgea piscis]